MAITIFKQEDITVTQLFAGQEKGNILMIDQCQQHIEVSKDAAIDMSNAILRHYSAKGGGRKRVTDRPDFNNCFNMVLERLRVHGGDLSYRQGARELKIGASTLKALDSGKHCSQREGK